MVSEEIGSVILVALLTHDRLNLIAFRNTPRIDMEFYTQQYNKIFWGQILQNTLLEGTSSHNSDINHDLLCRYCKSRLAYRDANAACFFFRQWCRPTHMLWKSLQKLSCRRLQLSINFAQFFFSNTCLMRVLLLSSMEPVARKLLTYYWITFLRGTGASGNFPMNLRQHFM
jgi:hypothetical protein